MIRLLSSSKDTYITNKITNTNFRATDANVGQAGSLDLFKLYSENVSGSDLSPIELSRLLIHFDMSEIKSMHNDNIIDVGDSSFRAFLNLYDIYGGQTTPSNFKLICFPLSQSFDEGKGIDIVNYADLDATNFITASDSSGTTKLWNLPGALKSGSLGDTNIDVIVSGTVSGQDSAISFSSEQHFSSGQENLSLDVTNFVSASVKNLIANHGFCIGFSGSFEANPKTYFVKRFASRDVSNTALRPNLKIMYDDSLSDNHSNFEFDYSGSLYLSNYSRGSLENAVTGLAATEVSGHNCMILKIESGSFSKQFNVSQAVRGQGRIKGVYSASFAISSYETALYDHVLSSGSIDFDAIWSNSAETVTFLSSSLTIKKNTISPLNFTENRYLVSMINLRPKYRNTDFVRLRVHVENADREIQHKKKPFEMPSEMFENMHFRIKDFESRELIVGFDEVFNSTKLSNDKLGMYFDFYMSSVPRGRSYFFEFMIRNNNFDIIIEDVPSRFVVE